MRFSRDCAVVREAVGRDPSCAGHDLSAPLAEMEAATDPDLFLCAAMRVLAPAGNGHTRIIPNAAIRVWPVRIVARQQGFGMVQGAAVRKLETVNGVPVADALDRFRPMLAGTPARQSVIGAMLLAWPTALGAASVTYGLDGDSVQFGPDRLVPALPLYPMSDTGRASPDEEGGALPAPVVWDDPVWHVRIARFSTPLPPGLAERILTRPHANIVVDLRGNTGGDFTRILPVIDALRTHWHGTRLSVRVDRFTFSAAIVAAVLFQHHLGARLFGEAMGDGLRFWAEGDTMEMPDTGAHLRWSSAWHDWETGQPDATTPPEIARHMVATGPLRITPCTDGAAAHDWAAG
ncbi:hypothetical protein [uncultured Tateyamaria sp.]|uniref:hypothetical protein n=1 Tax=Tateyamaria sp. 1078 TaxID=3417464 RepID=UPI00262849EF|nr:hypothetical protein [uncultured Tateyamaria sp.]